MKMSAPLLQKFLESPQVCLCDAFFELLRIWIYYVLTFITAYRFCIQLSSWSSWSRRWSRCIQGSIQRLHTLGVWKTEYSGCKLLPPEVLSRSLHYEAINEDRQLTVLPPALWEWDLCYCCNNVLQGKYFPCMCMHKG